MKLEFKDMQNVFAVEIIVNGKLRQTLYFDDLNKLFKRKQETKKLIKKIIKERYSKNQTIPDPRARAF